ncbi:MAG: hypothetical protein MUC88_12345 [Planctomycetes bacterium]|jgi:hypothetical protein|nr:hypothetical protein [Planctomycetota bacterium]
MILTRKNAAWALLAAGALLAAAVACRALLSDARRIERILAAYPERADYPEIALEYPLDGTLFPPEIVPPTFRWEDTAPASGRWLVRIALADGEPALEALVRRPRWTPRPQDWENLKRRSRERDAQVVILGLRRGISTEVLSRAGMSFRTSRDPVGAPLFYREVVLPFVEADKNPSRIRWRFGSIDTQPPIVLEKVPVCTNCHSFNRDGTVLAMDADYALNKGAYLIAPVREEMTLTPGDLITWNDYERSGETFGLLSQISPDGRYVVSTVKDKAVFVPRPPLAFSQLFYPVAGILCVYDRQTRQFRALPGADDPNLVQSNPVWSPDGREIVFARAVAADLRETRGMGLTPLTRADCELLLKDGRPFRFDLYKIPFRDGSGGTPQPLPGASHNGRSNYFPRYSPDGRWIVFCQADSYMLLQPDSELFIIPSEGGAARRLRANTRRMNSWHSFAPNGKWLVFPSKGWSDYTQLCLTHLDENGDSTPPVLLSHLTAPDRAANIPEFVNTHPAAIRRIRAQFLQNR